MKFWYITIMEGYTIVFSKKCLTVQEANELFIKKKEEFASPKYQVLKENY